jgi:uncharacterized coiled-coil protein SlyX
MAEQEQEPTVEQLTEKLDTLIKKQKSLDELRSSIIKLQEDLIGELGDQLETEKERGLRAFKTGMFFGLVVGTVICIVADLIIAAIR